MNFTPFCNVWGAGGNSPKQSKVKTGTFQPQAVAQIAGLPQPCEKPDFYNGEKNSRDGDPAGELFLLVEDWSGNCRAEVTVLNLGRFAGSGVGNVPERHVESVCGGAPKRHNEKPGF